MSEQIYLLSAGSIPGIPGTHGPGLYEVDYEARTATPVSVSPTVDETPAPDPNATQPLPDTTSAQTQDQTTTSEQQQ